MRAQVSIRILVALLTSALLGCASTEKDLELEKRAAYDLPPLPKAVIGQGSGGFRYVPTRVPERVVVPWLFPHELSPKEYFWGGWLSVTLAPEGWEMTKVPILKKSKSSDPRPPDKPNASKVKKNSHQDKA